MQIDIDFEQKSTKNYTIYFDNLKKIVRDNKVAIITNPTVAGLHLKKLLNFIDSKELFIITIADGERYKNQKSVEYILENLFNHKFDRKSLLIAFGGGVIGDITGYCASIFQRGCDFIQIPTTLLSQVDASVGGKTGINNKFGKNLIGAFYQPKAVYIQSSFLKTLPQREFSAGVAEIIKMAVTFDADFFNYLESVDLYCESDLKKVIYKAVNLKAKVVAQDEKEAGIRAVLNYGHTFAHVIENETNYKKFLHGEAVSIGINMANTLSYELNLMSKDDKQRVENLLKKYKLPTTYHVEDIESFYEKFFLDKKSNNSKLKFILSPKIGKFVIKDDIKKDTILRVLQKFKDV